MVGLLVLATIGALAARAPQDAIPAFELDPAWPKPLPNNWMFGGAASIAVDSHDHVWVLHRPKTSIAAAAIAAAGKQPAPPVIEFDAEGNVLQAWGGPGAGYSWMEESTAPFPVGSAAEHGIFVDHKDNIWVTGNGHVALKFTRAGKFLLQIGQLWKTGGSNDQTLLGNPTDMDVDPRTDELYVADGYVNHRVIVFDANTGAYKRHWGAYGNTPDDGPIATFDPEEPLPQQFYAVHCVRLASDGLVYVCDRQRDRIQVFSQDGRFVREVLIAQKTATAAGLGGAGFGSVYRIGFSADQNQRYLYVADSSNAKVWILTRNSLQVIGSFDARGLHHLAGADSKGSLYTTGTMSPQRFRLKTP
jgi:hypothetical protein